MAKNTKSNQLAVAVGAALTMSLAAVPMTNAQADNPFGLTELASGYMLAASAAHGATDHESEEKDHEGSCGEGRCGAEAADDEDADADADKDGEGSCGEGEGKCGEGRCGGS